MIQKILGRILVCDDEKNLTFVVQAMLERAGYEVVSLNDSLEAIKAIDEEEFDTIITDLYMPKLDGMGLLKHCQKHHPDLPVVMITAFGTVEKAVTALKKGAFDFITKPFEQSELLAVVKKSVKTYRQREKEPTSGESSDLSDPLDPSDLQGSVPISETRGLKAMIGQGALIQEVFRVIHKVAKSPSTVLISGESGTGKELVAQEIHRSSDRVHKPFVKINCAAIPSTLIESELFGYERGAFTGAVSSKPGRFELAHEGTLFMDEVAEMPLEMQVKLLRVIQEQSFERVGGIHSVKVDVRMIAATNRNLEEEVKAGRFREDLYYRLNVVPIHLPPLRDRVEDLEILIDSFIARFNVKLKKSIKGIDSSCLAALKKYQWPGNIRQLENALERMILMCDGEVLQLADLPEEIFDKIKSLKLSDDDESPMGEIPGFKEIVRKRTQTVERELIERALEETGGNVTRAAEKLQLSRKGLQLKMKELGIRRNEP